MNIILQVKFGSHLYGTNTPTSDADFKAIYLPTAREIVLEKARRNVSTSRPKQEYEKNTKDDVDSETFSLKEYLRLLIEGQTVALDMLFAPENFKVVKGPEYHLFDHIYTNREKLLSKGILSFIGYARKQASKYGIKGSRVRAVRETLTFLEGFPGQVLLKEIRSQLDTFVAQGDEFIRFVTCDDPNGATVTYFEVSGRKFQLTNSVKYSVGVLSKIYNEYGQRAKLAEVNDGIDWKALSHAVRVNFEGQELLQTGFITFPCPEKQLLLDIKTGKLPYKEVEVIIEKGLQDLEVAQANSILQEKPDEQWAEDFLYDVYSKIVKGS